MRTRYGFGHQCALSRALSHWCLPFCRPVVQGRGRLCALRPIARVARRSLWTTTGRSRVRKWLLPRPEYKSHSSQFSECSLLQTAFHVANDRRQRKTSPHVENFVKDGSLRGASFAAYIVRSISTQGSSFIKTRILSESYFVRVMQRENYIVVIDLTSYIS